MTIFHFNKEKMLRYLISFSILDFTIIHWNVVVRNQPSQILLVLYYFSIIFSIIALVFSFLVIVNKGYCDDNPLSKIKTPPNRRNYCRKCKKDKPERTHHCRQCNRCILKMDHHCNILSVCINFNNHGHFIRFLFFMFLASFSSLISLLYVFYHKLFLKRDNIKYLNVLFLICHSIYLLLSFLLILLHFILQITNMLYNITQIEQQQLRYNIYNESFEDNPYNDGYIRNIQSVLGPFKYGLCGRGIGDGKNFYKTMEKEYWPVGFNENIIV